MPHARLQDVDLFYRWDGAEDAPVLLFSNSLGTTHRMWDPQIAAFTKGFRVLRYDSRGHGQSSVTPGPYNIAQLAADAVGLLDFLNIERAHFCGLSMGGMVGMYLGSAKPERLRSAVLCNTAAKIGTPESWGSRIAAVQQSGMKTVAGAVIERWLTTGFREAHPSETSSALMMLENANAEGYVASCAAVRDMDFREKLGTVGVHTLVVSGSADPVTPPSDGKFLQQNIPGAKYLELPAAHLSNIEARDAFNEGIFKFLSSQGATT